jgi:large conductance mechanosensitive channel
MANIFKEFKTFLQEFNVVAVAVGIVTGLAVKDISQAVVDDLIMPVVGALLPGGGWAEWILPLGPIQIKIGHLMARSIDFLIICFVVFLFARAAAALSKLPAKVVPGKGAEPQPEKK